MLDAELNRLREAIADKIADKNQSIALLRSALQPLADWLGAIKDKGEQLGNLDMRLVDMARRALALTAA